MIVQPLPSAGRVPAGDYARLKRLVAAEGLLDDQPRYYWFKAVIALATLAATITVAVMASSLLIVLGAAAVLGFASTQVALLSHDVGHNQGFRGRRANPAARLFFGSLVLGVSHSWWTQKHNRHHATPNHVEKDPDIQFPIIAFDPAQVRGKPRVLRAIMGTQAVLFCALLPFQSAMIYVHSVGHLFSGAAPRARLQGVAMAAHFALYALLLVAIDGTLATVGFAVVHMAVFGVYNSSVFATNHKGMPTIHEDERLDFLREQVLTSRNVRAGWFNDFWYGGLNYQIEHHVFPTMPRNNLSRARPIVREFCRREGISYHETSLFAAYREALGHLGAIGAVARRSLRGGEAAGA